MSDYKDARGIFEDNPVPHTNDLPPALDEIIVRLRQLAAQPEALPRLAVSRIADDLVKAFKDAGYSVSDYHDIPF